MSEDTPIYDQMISDLTTFAGQAHTVATGDVFEWLGVTVTVTRLAADGTWVDLRCELDGHTWSKRQPLPFPEEAALVAIDADVAADTDLPEDTRPAYDVVVHREDSTALWTATVRELGAATDVENLDDLRAAVDDLIATLTGLDPHDFRVHYVPGVGPDELPG